MVKNFRGCQGGWEGVATEESLRQFGLRSSPFGEGAAHGAFYLGPQHRDAVGFLDRALHSNDLLVALTGEPGAGKSSTVDFALSHTMPSALVAKLRRLSPDGSEFLADLIEGFGFEGISASREEMRGLVTVFLGQKRQKGITTVIVAENPEIVSGSILEEIGWLSLLEPVRIGRLKLVLLGGEPLESQLAAPRMHALRQMIRWQHRLEPLGVIETRDYLEFRAEAAGSIHPQQLFAPEATRRIYEASGGLPARIDMIAGRALDAAAEAGETAVDVHCVDAVVSSLTADDRPKPRRIASLDISMDHQPRARIRLNASRLMIGRHPWNDVQLDHDSVSRHHAMLVREGGHWTIVDLNSTNGIRVNDHPVKQQRLRQGDIVQVGRYRLVLNEGVGPARNLPAVGDLGETMAFPG